MNDTLGPIRQNGYVVPDLTEATRHWMTVLGVGPFFRMRTVDLVEFTYRGVRTAPELSIAVAYSGDLQIELVQQHNDAPSPYRDFLGHHPDGGLHHVAVWPDQYQRAVAGLTAAGSAPDCAGRITGIGEFAYVGSVRSDGGTLEIADLGADSPAKGLLDQMKAAAEQWDGTAHVIDV